MQLEKWDLHRNETTVNSPVTVNSPSQNISDPSSQKQLRTQINNVPKIFRRLCHMIRQIYE